MKKRLLLITFFVLLGVWWLWQEKIHPPDAGNPPGEEVVVETDVFQDEETRFGFIRGIDTSGEHTVLMFDEAVMLSGEEAKDAAVRSGVCTEETREECTPNNFFIENVDETPVTHSVAEDVVVVMLTYRDDINTPIAEETISFERFVVLLNARDAHWDARLYRISLTSAGDIVRITEVYVP